LTTSKNISASAEASFTEARKKFLTSETREKILQGVNPPAENLGVQNLTMNKVIKGPVNASNTELL
jgi:hypothetical protein